MCQIQLLLYSGARAAVNYSPREKRPCMSEAIVALCAAGLGLGQDMKEMSVVNDGDCVAIFHSIHRVMKAEKLLKAQRLDMLLIPVPRQLTSDCGLAIRYRQEIRGEIAPVLAEQGLPPAEMWIKRQSFWALLQ